MTSDPRRLSPLDRDEALRRLAGVPVGRLVFTIAGVPSIRPVNHLVEADAVLIRTDLASATSLAEGSVVAYEADLLDADAISGWSVVVTGFASLVDDPAELDRYERLLHPWVAKDMTEVIRIDAETVTGYELVTHDKAAPAH